jgi:hypothetical protein
MFAKECVIDHIQKSEGAVSAPGTKYGPHHVIGEHGMDVFETGLIVSSQITLFIIEMWRQDNLMAEFFQEFYTRLKFGLKDGTCRGNNTDDLTLSELSGFDWVQRTFLFVSIENDHQALEG